MLPWYLWALACTGLAIWWRRRPERLAGAALALWSLVPAIAVGQVSTSVAGADVHPAAMLALAGLAATAMSRRSLVLRAVAEHLEAVILFVTVAVVATWLTASLRGGIDPLHDVAERFWAPLALLLLIGAACLGERTASIRLAHWFVALSALQAAFALAQNVIGAPLLYAGLYEQQVWFNSVAGRWMGTLDHPLVLNLMLTCAVPLLATVRRWWLATALLPLLLAGVLLTQSRVGLALAGLAACYVALHPRRPAAVRLAFGGVLVVTAAVLARSGLVSGVAARIADDTGSADARVAATDYFLTNAGDYLWLGQGLDANYLIAESSGLDTSLENSFLQLSVDLGIVVTVLFYLAMIACAVRGLFRGTEPGFAVSACVAVAMTLAFSGLATTSAAFFIVFYLVAGAAYQPLNRRRPRRATAVARPRAARRRVIAARDGATS